MSSFDFTDKSVIISGGGTGIGFEIAKSFVSCGAKVTIAGRRKDVLEEALLQIKNKIPRAENRILPSSCDMSNEKSARSRRRPTESVRLNCLAVQNIMGSKVLSSSKVWSPGNS